MKQDWGSFYDDGGILIADRYTTSNAVHQCCKLLPEEREALPYELLREAEPPP